MIDYTRVLADLRAKRETAKRELGELDTAIAGIERLAAAAAPDAHHLQGVPVAPLADLSMPDALEQCLRRIGHPEPKSRIKAALLKDGVPKNKDFGAKVYNALYRLKGDRFFQDADGRWGLVEWQQRTRKKGRARK